jgi:L,D-peptidoglycan transpeptidase YkuD (ErfK/YbiS/YcfS/YnhG family)
MAGLRALVLIGLWCLSTAAMALGSSGSPCTDRGTSVVIDLDRSRLWLCEAGVSVGRYRVALGQGGIAKRKRGDKKTPVGTYSLRPGRSSPKYHRFLAVGYPTARQRAQGYTGSAIGIHGPKRGLGWLGPLGSMVDWTLGCIAVSTDAQIEAIEAWVNTSGARKVHLVSGKEGAR